jgi:hypothetical protein
MQYLFQIARFLSQEPRYLIIQAILGHPDALASKSEIAHFLPDDSLSVVEYHLQRLVEHGIIAQYTYESDKRVPDFPRRFYGPTTYGVIILGELGYLDSVPMMRAIQQRVRKSESIRRHLNAPRPTLPLPVRYALRLGEFDRAGDGQGA